MPLHYASACNTLWAFQPIDASYLLLAALEKQQATKEAYGEIDTAHPGYLGCQDTYYVGNFKGIGRVYGQVFIDSYSRLADAKL